MSRIGLLPDEVVNRIAAGEVIERPASVVKELVENSLDAGAGSVQVAFSGAGLEFIEVIDDGLGMTLDEIEMAVQRFATSKIRSFDDLSSITSFGFRGEALPSIASVSKLEIVSVSREAGTGGRVYIEGGALREREEIFEGEGTTVRVKDLFFNTPARKKFLKSLKVERGHIVNAFLDAAMSAEGVDFTLIEDDRVLFEMERELDFFERVRRREKDLGNDLLEFEEVSPYFIIKGLISRPTRTYPTSSHVRVFVNRRPVREPAVLSALREGLKGLIPENRYPVAYIHVEVSPEEVDFNVHPTKREVRFRYVRELHEIVRYSVRKRVRSLSGVSYEGERRYSVGSWGGEIFRENRGDTRTSDSSMNERGTGVEGREIIPTRERAIQSKLPVFEDEVRFVGQVLGNYLLFESGEMMVILDLHAVSERITYEKLERAIRGELESEEPLLISVEIPVEKLAGWEEEVLEVLKKMGCHADINEEKLVFRSIPRFLKGVDLEAAVSDIVDEMGLDWGKGGSEDERMHRIVSTVSCHSSLRGEEKIGKEEAIELYRQLLESPYGETCPHGRPVYLVITKDELHRMFGRK